jgi:hypothetical protein
MNSIFIYYAPTTCNNIPNVLPAILAVELCVDAILDGYGLSNVDVPE